MVEVVDKREMMANQLLMRGHATMQELLTASFGEWPPKGLNVSPDVMHDQRVELKTFVQAGVSGQGSLLGKREIGLNTAQREKSDGLHSTLGHEAIHILQGDHSLRKHRYFLQQMACYLLGIGAPASNTIMKELTSRKEGSLSAKFAGAARDCAGEQWAQGMGYLRQGIEVQARIHQIIIEGYPRWGKVPATLDEFHAAMKNAGLRLPAEIEKRLESLPDNSSARSFLACARGGSSKVKDIEAVNNSMSGAGQGIFWNKTMPALYADLVKMYGDAETAKKFGLEAKTTPSPAAKQTSPTLKS